MRKEPIEHAHFASAKKQLRYALKEHKPGEMVAICGMPGSGKTYIRNMVLREILGAPDSWGVGYTPVTEVWALLDTDSAFSSRAFAARSHRAALRPDLRALYRDADEREAESYLQHLCAEEKTWSACRTAQRTPEHEYWQSFGEAVLDRKIKYVLIEHAAAIGRSTDADVKPKNHLWNLMTLFESTGCMGILNLIPEGYDLWEGRPEISERLERVFIRPYEICDKAQLTEFARLVFDVAKEFELESDNVVKDQIIEIAIATATSIRPVKKLFGKACVNAMARGSSKIGFIDIASAFETTDHISALWKQASLLHEISKPATKDELLGIHRLHLSERE